MLGFKEMNFASFELKTIKFIKFLKANFQQNIHQFVGILNEDFTWVYASLDDSGVGDLMMVTILGCWWHSNCPPTS